MYNIYNGLWFWFWSWRFWKVNIRTIKNLYFNEAIEKRDFERKAQKHQAIMDFAHSLILKKMDEEDERITNLCREEISQQKAEE